MNKCETCRNLNEVCWCAALMKDVLNEMEDDTEVENCPMLYIETVE